MFSLGLEEGSSLTCDVLVLSITKIFRVNLKVTLFWFQNLKLVSKETYLIALGGTDWCEGLVIGFKSSRSHRLWREPVSIIFLTALLKKLVRFISQVARRPGAHVTILSAPGAQPELWGRLTFILVGWQERLGPLSKQISLIWEGNSLSSMWWNSQAAYLAMLLFGLTLYFDILNSLDVSSS